MAASVFQKRATVPHSALEMYRLVNDVRAYPDFLPWCKRADILEQKEGEMVARLVLAVGRIRFSMVTRNRYREGRDIRMQLVEGPFKILEGCWEFQDRDTGPGCEIGLRMEFEFRSILAKYTLGMAFNAVIHSLVECFIRRARALPGRKQS